MNRCRGSGLNMARGRSRHRSRQPFREKGAKGVKLCAQRVKLCAQCRESLDYGCF